MSEVPDPQTISCHRVTIVGIDVTWGDVSGLVFKFLVVSVFWGALVGTALLMIGMTLGLFVS
jgi:hypothetical protein